ncbi:hypothetical protein [Winogradskyella sp. PG-2]|uniref:hypothetical protein n=1 Tax=Winogradskyella sp. PG-2 TaxID=754409 RepID=UPI0005F08953|nr:hypothetical protein [Winogradskyella sp. PG-2]
MRLRKVLFLMLFVLFFCICNIQAQIVNNITKPSLSKTSLAEKIYLQLDNTIYQTGEKIWFKTIVSKSFDNSLTDISSIIYVELIDFNENIIEKKMLKLN